MGRKILLITSDQQRADAFGCTGGTVARTPVVDSLAAAGTSYARCHTQSVVCMPSRATILTGQHPSTHGVWMNGVQLAIDTPSVASVLRDAGYRTALIGKSHFDPFIDPFFAFPENSLAMRGQHGPLRGFDHLELAAHSAAGFLHYASWIRQNHPEAAELYYPVLDANLGVNGAGGGDTGAPQVQLNTMPRDWYHTDWVAARAVAWLDAQPADADWFLWLSFPDPHHPWDPPAAERARVPWKDLELPAGYLGDRAARERALAAKPRHWQQWYEGSLVANFEAPPDWVPASLTDDQVREVNALVHVENELIDEAIGSVLQAVTRRGWDPDTDVLVTTDHGELQGDFGLLFKGPYHVDGLVRLPLIWRPAPSAGVQFDGSITDPVGLVDVAPTVCEIAGVAVPDWMQGRPLPTSNGSALHQRQLTEWDSSLFGVTMSLRTLYRDGMQLTAYAPGTVHDGTEGELYDMADDPLQEHNRWDDPAMRALRDDLFADLVDATAVACGGDGKMTERAPWPVVDRRAVSAPV